MHRLIPVFLYHNCRGCSCIDNLLHNTQKFFLIPFIYHFAVYDRHHHLGFEYFPVWYV